MAGSSLDKLRWVYHRLRAMSTAEALWRTRQALEAASDRAARRLRPRPRPNLERIAAAAAEGREGEVLLFGEPPAYRRFLPGEPQRGRRALRRRIDRLPPPARLQRAGGGPRARVLGVEVPLDASLDWNRDPVTGRRFPAVHWSSIDHRRPDDEAAIRRIWYLNRHLALPDLALDFHLHDDAAAAELACEAIDSWITQCQPQCGVNWMIPLEIALRLWSWSWTARLLAGAAPLARLARRLAPSVHLQAEHVRRHLSAHSSANNHLLVQGLGLLAAGTAFSGLVRARLWRETGRHILLTEIERQTHADGVSREQSRHYHELVLEVYLASWLLVARSVGPLPARARERLERMLEFLADLDAMQPATSGIGDSDDQSALPFLGSEPPAADLLAIGAVLFGRGDWKAAGGELPRAAAVLLDAEQRERYAALEPLHPEPGSRLYRSGGYAVLRAGGGSRTLLFDCGPLGFLRTAAHGHADCLAITLSAFGEAMLIDPGTYTYHAEPAWRDYFRSTAAHNTVRVDGVEQSEMCGPFLWGRKARGRPAAWSSTPAVDYVEGWHDGYRGLPGQVIHHRRLLLVKPDYIWVEDEIEGEGEHLLEQFFHFPPCRLTYGQGGAASAAGAGRTGGTGRGAAGTVRDFQAGFAAGAVLDIGLLGDERLEADILVGVDEPRQGWRSPAFGVKEPAPVLRLHGRRRLPVRLHCLLRPLPARPRGAAGRARVQEPAPGLRVLVASGMPGTDLGLLQRARGGAVSASLDAAPGLGGRLELEGEMALVRWNGGGDPAGQPVTLAGAGLRRLVVGGRLLIEMLDRPQSFSLRRLGDQAVWSGSGEGRIRLWAPGLRSVRHGGRLLPVGPADAEGMVVLELGDQELSR